MQVDKDTAQFLPAVRTIFLSQSNHPVAPVYLATFNTQNEGMFYFT